jgi:galactose mutarotase-like enzyme
MKQKLIKKTIINLTQHSYLNLSANFSKTILDHEITINADTFIPLAITNIPIRKFADVTNCRLKWEELLQKITGFCFETQRFPILYIRKIFLPLF